MRSHPSVAKWRLLKMIKVLDLCTISSKQTSLAGQTLTWKERVWSISHHHLVSNMPKVSWCVNWVSGEWRCASCLFWYAVWRDRRPAYAEHVPIYVHTYFIRCAAAEYAIQKPDGKLTRLSPHVRVWPRDYKQTSVASKRLWLLW